MRNIHLLSLVICLLLCGCFFKSDKTGTADDIISEMIYTGNAGPVLIAREKVFHANSKSTRGGFTNISGYSNTRLSVYDLKNGQLLARSVLGKETKDGSMVLTLVKDQLWVLSSGNPQFGFKWSDITGQQLVLTWMLHTSCIDVNSGKILWQIRH